MSLPLLRQTANISRRKVMACVRIQASSNRQTTSHQDDALTAGSARSTGRTHAASHPDVRCRTETPCRCAPSAGSNTWLWLGLPAQNPGTGQWQSSGEFALTIQRIALAVGTAQNPAKPAAQDCRRPRAAGRTAPVMSQRRWTAELGDVSRKLAEPSCCRAARSFLAALLLPIQRQDSLLAAPMGVHLHLSLCQRLASR